MNPFLNLRSIALKTQTCLAISRLTALLCFCLLACTCLPSSTIAAELVTYPGCTYLPTEYGDGDSFRVMINQEEHVLRLYFVDCAETTVSSDSDRRRVLEQARHFAVEPARIIASGREARKTVAALLSEQPFTVHTAKARALGRSKKPRIYGMITLSNGEDLAQVLITKGLARSYGVKRTRPDGISSEEYDLFLTDAELVAAVKKQGIWAHSNPEQLVAMRRKQRDDTRELKALTLGAFSTLSKEEPLDLNQAESEELQQIDGIGPSLAERIIKARPFLSVDELNKVHGIGPKTIETAKPFLTVGVSH